jgi:hypothetical protein
MYWDVMECGARCRIGSARRVTEALNGERPARLLAGDGDPDFGTPVWARPLSATRHHSRPLVSTRDRLDSLGLHLYSPCIILLFEHLANKRELIHRTRIFSVVYLPQDLDIFNFKNKFCVDEFTFVLTCSLSCTVNSMSDYTKLSNYTNRFSTLCHSP